MERFVAIMFSFMPLSFILLIDYFFNIEEDLEEDLEDEENFVRVAILEDKAYWVLNNSLYVCDYVDGEVIKETSEKVNAFDLDFKEVNTLMQVLDGIKDWKEE